MPSCIGTHELDLKLPCCVQGSEAAPLVQDWVKAAQSRAVAEQTSALLQAHAATLAASLSQA